MTFPYAPPTVIVQEEGFRSLVGLTTLRPAVVFVGTAPQGPDSPVLIDPASAATVFGDPGTSTAAGYSLPLMMRVASRQRPAVGGSRNVTYLVCRCGVVRASADLPHPVPVSQIWTLSIDHTIQSGSFALTTDHVWPVGYAAIETGDIEYDILDSTGETMRARIQAALEDNFPSGSFTVAAGTWNDQTATNDTFTAASPAWTITAIGAIENTNLPDFSLTDQDLLPSDGGTNAGDGIVVTVPGGASGVAFTAEGVGAYAGSAGDNLFVYVVADADGNVLQIAIYDSLDPVVHPPVDGLPNPNWILLQIYTSITSDPTLSGVQPTGADAPFAGPDDLSSAQSIANTINGNNDLRNPNSVINVTHPSTTSPLPAPGLYQLSGGSDGQGTSPLDDEGAASIAALLSASLQFRADYIVAAWDAGDLAEIISAHLFEATSVTQFRKAVLGPAQGVTYARLTTQSGGESSLWYNSFQSARVVVVGHDTVLLPNPLTGHVHIYDGFYLAAAVAGLKAISPPEETCISWALQGVVGTPLPPDSDITVPLTTAQKNKLAASGFLVVQPGPTGAIEIRDDLTTSPFSVNNAINPFSQWNVQTIDDEVSEVLLRAVLPYKGRPMPSIDAANALLQRAALEALAGLGSTINGVNSVVVTTDVNSLIPTIDVSYITRFPFRTIIIRTSYTFS